MGVPNAIDLSKIKLVSGHPFRFSVPAAKRVPSLLRYSVRSAVSSVHRFSFITFF
jgi:hypothetical protein